MEVCSEITREPGRCECLDSSVTVGLRLQPYAGAILFPEVAKGIIEFEYHRSEKERVRNGVGSRTVMN